MPVAPGPFVDSAELLKGLRRQEAHGDFLVPEFPENPGRQFYFRIAVGTVSGVLNFVGRFRQGQIFREDRFTGGKQRIKYDSKAGVLSVVGTIIDVVLVAHFLSFWLLLREQSVTHYIGETGSMFVSF